VLLKGLVVPKWHELGVNPMVDTKGYTLHCKDVPTLDQQRLLALPAHDGRIPEDLRDALRWINDASLYSDAKSDTLEGSRLKRADTDKQIERGKVEPCEDPQGTCKVFLVPEHAKKRFRCIQHPRVANANTLRDKKITFTSFPQRHRAILEGQFTIDLDWSAFFDQLLMNEEVRKYFAFRDRSGRILQMRVMPMGLKHSVAIAQLATLQLTNFMQTAYFEEYIDNVRIIGKTPQQVIRDAAQLLCRCVEAGVTVNDVVLTPIREATSVTMRLKAAETIAATLVKQKGPWLGEHYDYVAKTVEISDKTREKVRRCFDSSEKTFRNLAAAFGTLLFASRTLGLQLAPYFAARRAMAAVGFLTTEDDRLWDSVAPALTKSTCDNIRRWQSDILAAGPRKITEDNSPDLVLITDASDVYGWGAISIDSTGGEMFFAAPWSLADLRCGFTKSSTSAEPEAIYRASCRFIKPLVHTHVCVISDNSAAVGALSKGHSGAHFMNDVCCRLQATFPKVRFTFSHIKGTSNPADGISRGAVQPSEEDWQIARESADRATERTQAPERNG